MKAVLAKVPGGKNLPISAVIRSALDVGLPLIDATPALLDATPAVRRGPKKKK